MSHKRLFIPGPTEAVPEVLGQQTQWLIGHRSKDYTALYTGIIDKLHQYFETRQHATVLTASGTIWMDITARNMVRKKALAGVCGAFSQRMANTIRDSGKEVTPLEVEWGKAIKPEMVLEELAKDDYDTVAVVHNETSTGVRNPIGEIGAAIKKEYPDVMFVVDAVSSAGGDHLVPENLNTDIIFASTQKCFALPPGLSIAFYSDEAVERARSVPGRGFYTDLIAIHDYYGKKQQNPTTPNISLMYALTYQLDRMLAEGAQARHQRHEAMAQYTRNWAAKDMEMFAEPGYESITVSTIANTQGRDIAGLNGELAKRGYQIANGYGAKLKEKTFRIGHMGEWTLDDVKSLLWHIDEIWRR
ncbi:MAG: alanine--glyoxylate aminotransferase family protein [Thermoplasmata archaeon]|nr:alanine--glyoxylate aminotransferase family protein [Thermoplasmata archaeon]